MMTYDSNSISIGQNIARNSRAFKAGLTLSWPPSHRTIHGSLSSIPGNVIGTSFISGPAICLPDCSNANSTLD